MRLRRSTRMQARATPSRPMPSPPCHARHRKSWNFIPVGRAYTAVFHCYGGTLRFESNEELVRDVLEHVARKAPWALVGYSDELKKQFNKDPKEVCREVEARKARLGAPAPRKLRSLSGMDARTALHLTQREATLGARKLVPVSYPLAWPVLPQLRHRRQNKWRVCKMQRRR